MDAANVCVYIYMYLFENIPSFEDLIVIIFKLNCHALLNFRFFVGEG